MTIKDEVFEYYVKKLRPNIVCSLDYLEGKFAFNRDQIANAAARLVNEGKLERTGQGAYSRPEMSQVIKDGGRRLSITVSKEEAGVLEEACKIRNKDRKKRNELFQIKFRQDTGPPYPVYTVQEFVKAEIMVVAKETIKEYKEEEESLTLWEEQ